METSIIEIWKELKVHHGEMEFSCGGDSMTDYQFRFFDSYDKPITSSELEKYFEDEVFKAVEFYEASDGYYMGEFGNVRITLEGEEFEYDKSATAEYSENYSDTMNFELTDEERQIIEKYVQNINGSTDGSIIIYKIDCILTDELEEKLDDLCNRIKSQAESFEFSADGEADEWFSFTTNNDERGDLVIDNNNDLQVHVTRSFTVYSQSLD